MRDVTFSRLPARLRRSDHRLWLAVPAVVIAAAAAVTAIIMSGFPSHGGPVHAMQTPARIGSFARSAGMESTMQLAGVRTGVIQAGAGQASNVTSAVYESGNPAPAASIADFTRKFAGAAVVSAGSLGGQAACAEEGATSSGQTSMCVWFDNDSFGEIVSPTMNATTLATVMRTVRPDLEIVVKN
jgi:hypothetical protein